MVMPAIPSARRLWLASASPRRLELLRTAGYDPERLPPSACAIDEAIHDDELVDQAVTRLARQKAERALSWPDLPANAVVLAGDTVVVVDGHILGKPRDRADAVRMLRRLGGSEHEVLTAIAAGRSVDGINEIVTRLVSSRVWLRPLSPALIDAYVATAEPDDKAGAYAIQGVAAQFVERIEGSCSGVVGLPLAETHTLLATFDVLPDWCHGDGPLADAATDFHPV